MRLDTIKHRLIHIFPLSNLVPSNGNGFHGRQFVLCLDLNFACSQYKELYMVLFTFCPFWVIDIVKHSYFIYSNSNFYSLRCIAFFID